MARRAAIALFEAPVTTCRPTSTSRAVRPCARLSGSRPRAARLRARRAAAPSRQHVLGRAEQCRGGVGTPSARWARASKTLAAARSRTEARASERAAGLTGSMQSCRRVAVGECHGRVGLPREPLQHGRVQARRQFHELAAGRTGGVRLTGRQGRLDEGRQQARAPDGVVDAQQDELEFAVTRRRGGLRRGGATPGQVAARTRLDRPERRRRRLRRTAPAAATGRPIAHAPRPHRAEAADPSCPRALSGVAERLVPGAGRTRNLGPVDPARPRKGTRSGCRSHQTVSSASIPAPVRRADLPTRVEDAAVDDAHDHGRHACTETDSIASSSSASPSSTRPARSRARP